VVVLAFLVGTLVLVAPDVGPAPASAAPASVTGTVQGGGAPVPDVPIRLLRAGQSVGAPGIELASTTADGSGTFVLDHDQPSGVVLYVVAEVRPTVRLVVSLGTDPGSVDVVVDEATTVAAAYALAQWTTGDDVAGTDPGLPNAAGMAAKLADPATGQAATALTSSPNGGETDALPTFGSLANLVAACIDAELACVDLLAHASVPGEPAPTNTFQAMGNLARHPNGAGLVATEQLYLLSQTGPAPYSPVRAVPPDAWTLALRFDGGGGILDGPGNFAVDHEGSLWVPNNYSFDSDPNASVCGGKEMLRFTPTGDVYPGSPYRGGGIDGIGFGVARDPFGDIWVANFGFASPPPGCADADQPPHDSVTQLRPDGTFVSPDTGWTQGGPSWPQGIASTDDGDIWFTTCENDLVVRYPGGDPGEAQVLSGLGIDQGMHVVTNDELVFVSGTLSDNVAVLDHEGVTLPTSPLTGGGLQHPMGMAVDEQGNVWVSNSGLVDLPCGHKPVIQPHSPSVTLIGPDGTIQSPAAGFTGGGLFIPWGITVDGDGNVWVANFGGFRLSHLCGADPSTCPPGHAVGDAISPPITGYGFNGLTRNTGVVVDTAGNVWLANNWIVAADPQANPGGNQLVAYVGLAPPVQPLAPRERPVDPPTPPEPDGPVAGRPTFTG
jgi:sugar lactone lactonase YvrE